MEIVKTQFGSAEFSIETGRLAKQANGSVLVQYGDTMVLVAATADKGFFPARRLLCREAICGRPYSRRLL